MSVIAIVFILAALAMMVGPLMLMRPSKRQLQLTALRAKALELGLRVQMKSYEGESVAEYIKAWPQEKKDNSAWLGMKWSLVKKKYAHEIHFFNEWDWVDEGVEKEVSYVDVLQSIIEQLPSGVSGLNVNKLGVGASWNELGGTDALEVIDKQLDRLLTQSLAERYLDLEPEK